MTRLIATFTGGATNPLVRVYWDAEWEEFQVRIPSNRAVTHHTDSYSDAIGTARMMAGEGWLDHIRAFAVPVNRE